MSQSIKQWVAREKKRAAVKRGARFEDEIEQYLLSLGYSVEVAKPVKRLIRIKGRSAWRSVRVDFFGCLDVMALHPSKRFLAIQATTNRGALAQKRRDMEKINWNLEATRPQIWIRGHKKEEWSGQDHRGIPVSVFSLTPEGWVESKHYMKKGYYMGALI